MTGEFFLEAKQETQGKHPAQEVLVPGEAGRRAGLALQAALNEKEVWFFLLSMMLNQFIFRAAVPAALLTPFLCSAQNILCCS